MREGVLMRREVAIWWMCSTEVDTCICRKRMYGMGNICTGSWYQHMGCGRYDVLIGAMISNVSIMRRTEPTKNQLCRRAEPTDTWLCKRVEPTKWYLMSQWFQVVLLNFPSYIHWDILLLHGINHKKLGDSACTHQYGDESCRLQVEECSYTASNFYQ